MLKAFEILAEIDYSSFYGKIILNENETFSEYFKKRFNNIKEDDIKIQNYEEIKLENVYVKDLTVTDLMKVINDKPVEKK
jgi:hypothetical protein